MSNVASINKGNKGSKDSFLAAYIEAQNNQRIPEEVFFVAGAILTVGLPEFFFSFYGGLIPFFVLAISLLVGAGLGVATYYYRSPYQTLALSKGAVAQAPPSRKGTTKKAA
jgi:hypothetical protein